MLNFYFSPDFSIHSVSDPQVKLSGPGAFNWLGRRVMGSMEILKKNTEVVLQMQARDVLEGALGKIKMVELLFLPCFTVCTLYKHDCKNCTPKLLSQRPASSSRLSQGSTAWRRTVHPPPYTGVARPLS